MEEVHTMHQLKVELQNVRQRLNDAVAYRDLRHVADALQHLSEVDRLFAVLEQIHRSG